MTILNEAEVKQVEGGLTPEVAGREIGEMIAQIGPAKGKFVVTFATLGLKDDADADAACPHCGEADCNGSGEFVAGLGMVGATAETADDSLIRAFGLIGVELLKAGHSPPALLEMVKNADEALTGGDHMSGIVMIDGNKALESLSQSLPSPEALRRVVEHIAQIDIPDDDDIPQA